MTGGVFIVPFQCPPPLNSGVNTTARHCTSLSQLKPLAAQAPPARGQLPGFWLQLSSHNWTPIPFSPFRFQQPGLQEHIQHRQQEESRTRTDARQDTRTLGMISSVSGCLSNVHLDRSPFQLQLSPSITGRIPSSAFTLLEDAFIALQWTQVAFCALHVYFGIKISIIAASACR